MHQSSEPLRLLDIKENNFGKLEGLEEVPVN
jgi:hypothetical protein